MLLLRGPGSVHSVTERNLVAVLNLLILMLPWCLFLLLWQLRLCGPVAVETHNVTAAGSVSEWLGV